jgi:hypothetical protein
MTVISVLKITEVRILNMKKKMMVKILIMFETWKDLTEHANDDGYYDEICGFLGDEGLCRAFMDCGL